MKTIINTDNKPAPDDDKKAGGPSRDRIRQDKFSTLHLPCFLSDLNKHKS